MSGAAAVAAAGQAKGGAGAGGRGGGGPAPFLTKTHQMVEEGATDEVISWAEQGRSFVVWKPVEFARDLLPLHFKHCNFSSFVRQLNTYVFCSIAQWTCEVLGVRFHYNGEFVSDGNDLRYVGGSVGMSHIEGDKMSMPEVRGHLEDHCKDHQMVLMHWLFPGKELINGLRVLMHWLFPGKELINGLRVLTDDMACQTMSDCIPNGVIVDIFVESVAVDVWSDGDGREEKEEHSNSVQLIQPTNIEQRDIAFVSGPITFTSGAKDNIVVENNGTSDEDDSDNLPGDEYCSDADDEAIENKSKYNEFKKKFMEGEYFVFVDGDNKGMTKNDLEQLQVDNSSEDSDTSYFSSSEEEDSYDERSDGELVRRKPKFPRFDKRTPIPSFSNGMTFSGKKQFKKAVEKYALATRKVIKFSKNDLKRCRAKCEWASCPWFILLPNNSRTDGWQVSSFRDEHTCPPRRDNKLVTARRIAEMFETSIMANPGWKNEHMKQTVQEQVQESKIYCDA